MLVCQPYKTELLPLWRFRTPDVARESSKAIFARFKTYLGENDFVGADMARKYLQMGYTRSRRYANYRGGRKYGEGGTPLPHGTGDPLKSRSAEIFYKAWKRAEADQAYSSRKTAWKRKLG